MSWSLSSTAAATAAAAAAAVVAVAAAAVVFATDVVVVVVSALLRWKTQQLLLYLGLFILAVSLLLCVCVFRLPAAALPLVFTV